ncbi:testis-expressed protein 13B [Chionomys nivalis]|uniref:testis-expressed protein 13B n=1 Tax=Chionomys nivalis TaxID=269649 RepID=UPI00259400A2|nr:testis-expressed protein 13B [Chionomys nivalis]
MNPEDPSSGFRHDKVLTFINEQMSKQPEGSAFYQENLSLSWEEVEEKLRLLLEDNEMPSQAQEACAWGGLALGVRFAWRQGHLLRRRVQWLHDFASLHRSAAHALASDLKKLTDQQEMERKEAAFQLQLAHTRLAELQRERDLMRLKLLHTELRAFPVGEMSGATRAPATAGAAKAETQNAGETEEVTASDRAVGEPEKEVAMAAPRELEGTGELGGSIAGHFGVMDWKDYGILKAYRLCQHQMQTRTSVTVQPLKRTLPYSPVGIPWTGLNRKLH